MTAALQLRELASLRGFATSRFICVTESGSAGVVAIA